ncbi:MAG: hypothetical protein ACYC6X_03430 [Minisyncoccota bacterium]
MLKRASKGMYRVVTIDPTNDKVYLVEDIDSRTKALEMAHDHNKRYRGEMDERYHVFDDQGKHVQRDKD